MENQETQKPNPPERPEYRLPPKLLKEKGTDIAFMEDVIQRAKNLGWEGYYFNPADWAGDRLPAMIKYKNSLEPTVNKLAPNQSEEILQYLTLSEIYRRGNIARRRAMDNKNVFATPPDFRGKLDSAKWARSLLTTALVWPETQVFASQAPERKVTLSLSQEVGRPGLTNEDITLLMRTMQNMGGQLRPDGKTVALETSASEVINSIAHSTAASTSQ